MDSASKHYSTRSEISKNGSKSKTTATQSQLVLKPYHQNENDEMEEELEEEQSWKKSLKNKMRT